MQIEFACYSLVTALIMPTPLFWWRVGCASAASAVGLGAFGAHALKYVKHFEATAFTACCPPPAFSHLKFRIDLVVLMHMV